MEPNWEHIKKEIQSKKAPLSADDWLQMNTLLDAQNGPSKKGYAWWMAALILLFLAVPIIWIVQKDNSPKLPQTEIENKPSIETIEKEAPIGYEENDGKEENSELNKSTNEALPAVEINSEKQNKVTVSPSSVVESPNTSETNSAQGVDEKTSENIAEIAIENKTDSSKNTKSVNEPEAVDNLAQIETRANSSAITKAEIDARGAEETPASLDITNTETAVTNFPEREQNSTGKKGSWEIKLYVGPTYNAPNISYNSAANFTHKEYNSVTNNIVNAGWGMDAGAELSYYILPHFKLSSGFGYRNIVTSNNMNYEVGQIPVIDSASRQILGYITLPDATQYTSSSNNSFVYVGVPLSVFKEIDLGNRFSLTAEFVNTVSFLISQRSEEINPQSLAIQESPADLFNSVLFNYQLRLGVRYSLNNNFSLALEPAYRGSYNNIYNSDYISWKPSDFSLNLAIIYTFRN